MQRLRSELRVQSTSHESFLRLGVIRRKEGEGNEGSGVKPKDEGGEIYQLLASPMRLVNERE